MVKLTYAAFLGLMALTSPASSRDLDLAAKVEALGRINSATSPTLSPDGRRLGYLSNTSGSPQVWVRDLRDGSVRQVTDLPDPVGAV